MGNRELLWSQCREIGLNLEMIWATLRYFIFLQWHQCSPRLLRDFSGTLCSSIKQIKAPYLFEFGQGIALHAMQGNRRLIPERAASLMVFLKLRRETGVCSRVMAGVAMKNFCLFIDVKTPVQL